VSRDEEIAAALRPTFAREARGIAERLDEASRAGSREELRALAHRLVGSAGTVHETAIVDASRELELLAADQSVPDEAVVVRARVVSAAVHRVVGTIVADPAPAHGDPAAPESGRPVVVAIEDSPANVTLLHRIFESIPDVELVTTQTGRDGARLAVDRAASLVLLDLNLPDVPGEWVLDQLRGPDGRAMTKVVVVSAEAGPGQAEHARSLGASDYVAKPFDIGRLRTLVRESCLGGRAT
jgi:CheY-like chemotaxis protein/HPt (histidine-containing phosphotransfer) domain-containing protein